MPDPLNTTQLDLQNLPPEQAAAMARAQQLALQQQQQHALVGLLSAMPEAQKFGAAEYEQAGKERGRGQETAAGVLKIALGQKEADLRLQELKNQFEIQRGQLAVAMGQLEEGRRSHKAEEVIRTEATKPTVPANVLQDLSEAEKRLAELDALGKAVPALSWVTDLAKKPVQAAHEATKSTVSKYRAMGASNVPAESTGAPGPVPAGPVLGSAAAVPPQAAQGGHTHYRYTADRRSRMPTDDAGRQLGPVEKSATPWPK